MDFTIPSDVQHTLASLDEFIARDMAPLEREHPQFSTIGASTPAPTGRTAAGQIQIRRVAGIMFGRQAKRG